MADTESKTGKKTRDRLAATPFSSMEELKVAQKQIKMQVWAESEKARCRKELIEQEEYEYVRRAFAKGWITETDGIGAEIVKIRSDSEGVIRISLNPEFTADADRAKLTGELVQGLSASYAPIYYQAVGILPSPQQGDDAKAKIARG